jgi:hypothetical protein
VRGHQCLKQNLIFTLREDDSVHFNLQTESPRMAP